MDIRFRFVVAVVTYQEKGDHSSLVRLLNDEIEDEIEGEDDDARIDELESDLNKGVDFSKALSKGFPGFLAPKKDVRIDSTLVLSIQRFSHEGVSAAIREYCDFEWACFLARAAKVKNAKIIINQHNSEEVHALLFEGDQKITSATLEPLFEDMEEFEEYMQDILNDMEKSGFYLSSGIEDSLVFTRCHENEQNQSLNRRNLTLLN